MAYLCSQNIVDMHPYAICEDVYGRRFTDTFYSMFLKVDAGIRIN